MQLKRGFLAPQPPVRSSQPCSPQSGLSSTPPPPPERGWGSERKKNRLQPKHHRTETGFPSLSSLWKAKEGFQHQVFRLWERLQIFSSECWNIHFSSALNVQSRSGNGSQNLVTREKRWSRRSEKPYPDIINLQNVKILKKYYLKMGLKYWKWFCDRCYTFGKKTGRGGDVCNHKRTWSVTKVIVRYAFRCRILIKNLALDKKYI